MPDLRSGGAYDTTSIAAQSLGQGEHEGGLASTAHKGHMLTPAQTQGGRQVVGFSNFVLCASDV
jgi:hypothetical protein